MNVKKQRVTQTRMKLTWFGAINAAIGMYLGFFFAMPEAVYTGLGLMGVLIGGYQVGESYTKAKFIQKTNDVKDIDT